MAVRKFLDNSGAAQLNAILAAKFNEKQDVLTNGYDNLANKPQINGNTLTGDQTASDLGISIKNIDVLNLVDGAAMPSELDFENGKPKLYLIRSFQHNGAEVNSKLNQSLWLGYKLSDSNDCYLQFIQGRNNVASGRYDNYRFYTYYNPNNTENPYCSWTSESDNHITYSTTDLTAGTSNLATGSLYFVYQ